MSFTPLQKLTDASSSTQLPRSLENSIGEFGCKSNTSCEKSGELVLNRILAGLSAGEKAEVESAESDFRALLASNSVSPRTMVKFVTEALQSRGGAVVNKLAAEIDVQSPMRPILAWALAQVLADEKQSGYAFSWAAYSAGTMRESSVLPFILAGLEKRELPGSQPDMVTSALTTLNPEGDVLCSFVRSHVKDPSKLVKIAFALRALGRLSTPSVKALMSELSARRDIDYNHWGDALLYELKNTSDPTKHFPAVRELFYFAKEIGSVSIVRALRSVQKRAPGATQILLNVLDDKGIHPSGRAEAAEALGSGADSEKDRVQSKLNQVVANDREYGNEMRINALRALNRMNPSDNRSLEALRILQEPSTSVDVQVKLFGHLSEFKISQRVQEELLLWRGALESELAGPVSQTGRGRQMKMLVEKIDSRLAEAKR